MYANIDFIKLAEEDLKSETKELMETSSTEDLLEVLHKLVEIEQEGATLSSQQASVYMQLIKHFNDNNIEIPFGVEY